MLNVAGFDVDVALAYDAAAAAFVFVVVDTNGTMMVSLNRVE